MKFQALNYLIANNKKEFFKYFLKSPFSHFFRYFKSHFFSKRKTENGAVLIGIKNLHELKKLAQKNDTLLLLGFSYCQKPLSCPAGRFSEKCLEEKCKKCLISKYLNKKNVYSFSIPTISSLGKKIFEFGEKVDIKKIIFIITACDLSISMFEDIANMLNLKGIALSLNGKICVTFESFLKAEQGTKESQTALLPQQIEIIDEIVSLKELAR